MISKEDILNHTRSDSCYYFCYYCKKLQVYFTFLAPAVAMFPLRHHVDLESLKIWRKRPLFFEVSDSCPRCAMFKRGFHEQYFTQGFWCTLGFWLPLYSLNRCIFLSVIMTFFARVSDLAFTLSSGNDLMLHPCTGNIQALVKQTDGGNFVLLQKPQKSDTLQ